MTQLYQGNDYIFKWLYLAQEFWTAVLIRAMKNAIPALFWAWVICFSVHYPDWEFALWDKKSYYTQLQGNNYQQYWNA